MDYSLLIPSHLIFGYIVLRPVLMIINMVHTSEHSSNKLFYRTVIFQMLFLGIMTLVLFPFADPLHSIGVFIPLEIRLLVGFLVAGWTFTMVPRDFVGNSTIPQLIKKIWHRMPSIEGQKWKWICISLISAVSQELLYRGFLLFYLNRLLNLDFIWAVLISTLIYGFTYSRNFEWNEVFNSSYLGARLALLYLVVGNLIPSIAINAFFTMMF